MGFFRLRSRDMTQISKFFSKLIAIVGSEPKIKFYVYSMSFSLHLWFFMGLGFARPPCLGKFSPFFIIKKGIGVQEGIDGFVS